VISIAVEPKTKGDMEKMTDALVKLAQEDPSFRFKRDEDSGQTVIAGMGELHLEIIIDRMKREFKVEANVGAPQVCIAADDDACRRRGPSIDALAGSRCSFKKQALGACRLSLSLSRARTRARTPPPRTHSHPPLAVCSRAIPPPTPRPRPRPPARPPLSGGLPRVHHQDVRD
jgi:hypothetical protein